MNGVLTASLTLPPAGDAASMVQTVERLDQEIGRMPNVAAAAITTQAPLGPGGNSPVWMAINQSVTALTEQLGRRVVLIFTDGRNEPAPSQISVNVRDLVDRVRLANVMVYALAFSDVERRTGGVKVIPPDPQLRRLADDSGGGYFEVTSADRLGPLFTRVAEELHRQYLLGFAPPLRDGKVHQIAVKVKRPGMTARGRQTYVAPMGR